MYKVLEDKLKIYEGLGIKIITMKNPLVFIILTPIMLRTHKREFSHEIVFVDSSGSCDQTSSCVTFLFTASKIGALPLACILHPEQTEANYTLVFSMLKEALGIEGFGGFGYPLVLMTDDSKAERNALKIVFGNSTLLLCTFHLCQAFWRWLWDNTHEILKKDKAYIMRQFQKILYAHSEAEANQAYEEFCRDEVILCYDKLKNYMQSLWDRREEWAICFRHKILNRGHNTNNFVEASIRVFKDVVLQRCKAFNSCALVDFVCKVFESYHRRHLLSFSNSRKTKNKIIYDQLCLKAKNLIVKQCDNISFAVSSDEYIYTVHADTATCDCPYGQGGKFCKHLCAVENQFCIIFKSAPLLSCEDKKDFARISLGEDTQTNFFEDMMSLDVADEKVTTVGDDRNKIVTPADLSLAFVPNNEQSSVKDPSTVTDTALNRLSENFGKVVEILKGNDSIETANAINKVNNFMDKLKTTGDVLSFLHQIKTIKRGRIIGVQPTSSSRRKHRAGLTAGSKRIQAGRPSKFEGGIVKKRKCLRNLEANIGLNRANQKSH